MAALEGRGVTFVDDAATLERAGDIAQTRFGANGGLEIVYDSGSTRFVDVLHEARHVAQIQRAQASGLLGNRSIFNSRFTQAAEWGAYSYEQRLGLSRGFSADYMTQTQSMLQTYSRPTLYGGTEAAIMRAMEPRLR